MKVVLDTNVLVSGLLTPFGPAGEIIRLVASGDLTLFYDARIISEYRDVLLRPKFSFDQVHIGFFIDQIESSGEIIIGKPIEKGLPDPDDEPFLEVAIAGKAKYLITWNVKHYPMRNQQCVKIVNPAEFLQIFRKKT